jgi:hypothetical protein
MTAGRLQITPADALAAVGCWGHLATLQWVIAQSLDSVPAGSARVQWMARHSSATKASQEVRGHCAAKRDRGPAKTAYIAPTQCSNPVLQL